MKIIYLHIGIHKTGTTFLQNVLSKNRIKLLENGYYYPTSAIPNSSFPGHHFLPRTLSQYQDKFDTISTKKKASIEVWGKLLDEINDQETSRSIVISSEDFCLLSSDEILKLKNYLNGFAVTVIIYLRRQDEFLLSLYSELVKKGYYKSIDVAFHEYSERLNYNKLLNRWASIFGKNNLRIGIYQKSQCLLSDFFKKINLEIKLEELQLHDMQYNQIINGKTLKVIRFLNTIFIYYLLVPNKICQKMYMKRLQSSRSQKLIAMIPDGLLNHQILSQSIKEYTLERSQDINEQVAKEYFSITDHNLFG
ncbi:MAG: hypothetical protein ACO3EZ_01290 [Prochlorotrichaceae cyanobacterium]|jgi:hypothetical protein